MWPLIAKALLSGTLIVAIAEIGKRQPAVGALVASLPLVSVLGMILLWIGRPDAENMAASCRRRRSGSCCRRCRCFW